jgi:hypothetical protein
MTDRRNMRHVHRHARHALEDFALLQEKATLPQLTMGSGKEVEKLLHSLSHHLRHVVYRVGQELRDGR